MKNGNGKEQVEQQTRCTACGAVWGCGFIRKFLFEEEQGLNCPFCGVEGKSARELKERNKPK
jgi:hypothetical protein